MMSALDLDAIEARAKKAAWGWGPVWTVERHDDDDWSTVHADGQRDMVGCEDGDVSDHIAGMDPETTLALVARVRELEAQVERVRAITPGDVFLAFYGEEWGGCCDRVQLGHVQDLYRTALGGPDE